MVFAWRLPVVTLLPLLVCGAPRKATWINVWVNSNQSYVPMPSGNAANEVHCDWPAALERYNLSLEAGMTIEHPHAVDWVGGANFGNAYAMLSLIRRAGVDVVIPDFTNGFSNANSRFPVGILHHIVAEKFPQINISYAVSASSFAGAYAYLFETPAADTRNYLRYDGKPVFIVYASYDDMARIRAAHSDCHILFANGESTDANKAGWHTAPFVGYAGGNSQALWVAPSLDWQTGTPSRTWVTSASWFAYGMHAAAAARDSPPWLLIVGSFDDASERNMWMPAVTSTAASPDFIYRSLSGEYDNGVADPAASDWTVFYDLVTRFLTTDTPPAGRVVQVASRAPLSVGSFATNGVQAPPVTKTLYVPPPYPFNQGVDSTAGLLRSLHPLFPSRNLLFPIAESTGSVLQGFRLQSRDDKVTTGPVRPLAFGKSACGHDARPHTRVAPDGSVAVTVAGDLVLRSAAVVGAVPFAAAEALVDCDVVAGPGVAFITKSPGNATLFAVQKTYPAQSAAYVYPLAQAGQFLIYALVSGQAYYADNAGRVSLGALPHPGASNYSRFAWDIAPHPAGVSWGSLVSTVLPNGTRVAWSASRDVAVCGADEGADCLSYLTLRIADTDGVALDTAFELA
eukprot:Hpha_TRINITY_DN2381_c0_g1::TRINITY_DN2381_c0_g1_i1::g.504::m.504